MTEILIATIAAVSGILVSFIGQYYKSRKDRDTVDRAEKQELISSLKDLVEIRNIKIQDLEELVTELTEQVKLLSLQVAELQEVIVNQARLIQNLSKRNNNAP